MSESIHNLERTVLFTLFSNPSQVPVASDSLSPEDFSVPYNASVFSAFLALQDKGFSIARGNLYTHMGDDSSNFLDDFDKNRNLSCPESLNDCIQVMCDHKSKRYGLRVLKRASDLIEKSQRSDEVSDIAQKAVQAIIKSASSNLNSTARTDDLVDGFKEDLLERSENPNEFAGITTGFYELDKITSGLQGGEVIVVAGRPGMGKSTLALNICESFLDEGESSIIFSQEMPRTQLMRRFVSSKGSVNIGNLKNGTLTEFESGCVRNALKSIRDNWDVRIIDESSMKVSSLRGYIYKEYYTNPFGICVLDYIQLMSLEGAGGSNDSRSDKLGDISKEIKRIAMDLNIPIILVSQLSKAVDRRIDKRPVNADLRDSGAIEQDADLILFVYRDEEYNPDSPDKGYAEIIVGKQREGETGTIKVLFEGQYSRFRSLKA